MGHPIIKTPNLDRLAARGACFENLYVQGTVCMPSRASIMTGRYPCNHGVVDNGYDLPKSEQTIAHLLRDAGYHTMAVGRTHLISTQPRPDYSKTDFFGFSQCSHAQVYCGGTDPGNDYLTWIQEEHPEFYDEIAFANKGERQRKDMLGGSNTTIDDSLSMNSWVVKRSLEFLHEHQTQRPAQPFLLWAGTWDPHGPYRTPPPWDTLYDPDDIPAPLRDKAELDAYPPPIRKLAVTEFNKNPEISLETALKNTTAMFYGMISHIDDQVGRLVKGLEEMGILDDTIILFTSDHGDMMGDHWFMAKRLFFYDGALKVPGLMAGPGIKPGSRYDGFVENVDIAPTLLDLAGVDCPPAIQGKSWKPMLEGVGKCVHDDVFTEFQYHEGFGDTADPSTDENVASLYDGRYRIVYFQGRSYGQLFDSEKDPHHVINYWEEPDYADIKQMMIEKLLNRIMLNNRRPDTRVAAW
jgi:uncharacterized sulfatase